MTVYLNNLVNLLAINGVSQTDSVKREFKIDFIMYNINHMIIVHYV